MTNILKVKIFLPLSLNQNNSLLFGFAFLFRGSGRPLLDHPELTLVDDRDLGTQASAGQSAGGSSITSLTSRIERLQLLLKSKKKPPGLSQEALDCLHLEDLRSKVEGAVSRASQDCRRDVIVWSNGFCKKFKISVWINDCG